MGNEKNIGNMDCNPKLKKMIIGDRKELRKDIIIPNAKFYGGSGKVFHWDEEKKRWMAYGT